jgi:hypothetical protein
MKGVRKDMLRELDSLKGLLKELLHENNDERSRSGELLRINERRIEDRVAHLDSFQTRREKLGRKFRKTVPTHTSSR